MCETLNSVVQEPLPQGEGLPSRQTVYSRSIRLFSHSLDWRASGREGIHFTQTCMQDINCRELSEEGNVNLLGILNGPHTHFFIFCVDNPSGLLLFTQIIHFSYLLVYKSCPMLESP